MSKKDVMELLGASDRSSGMRAGEALYEIVGWCRGPNRIIVEFLNGKVKDKYAYFASAWETLEWYAEKGAGKIGVKWD